MDTARDRYNNKIKNFRENVNMNHVLSERFLSLFVTNHSQAYYNLLAADIA